MLRKLIVVALVAAPTVLLAAPQRHPSQIARPHTASSARGNATAGQADAARIKPAHNSPVPFSMRSKEVTLPLPHRTSTGG